MSEHDIKHGLEGVVAFASEIAEPDKEGSALRYRGVDIEDLVGRVPFENVWGLLVDGSYTPGLPPAEPYNIAIHTGDVRADVQASVAMLAPMLGMGQTYDISDDAAREDLSRVAVMVLSYAAQAARGIGKPVVPQHEVDQGATLAERFLIRWRGEADPKHVQAIDAYWSSGRCPGFSCGLPPTAFPQLGAGRSSSFGPLSASIQTGSPGSRRTT